MDCSTFLSTSVEFAMHNCKQCYKALLLVQSLYDQCMPRRANTHNVRAQNKERLIYQEGTIQEEETPNPQIHLKKVKISGLFYVKGRQN